MNMQTINKENINIEKDSEEGNIIIIDNNEILNKDEDNINKTKNDLKKIIIDHIHIHVYLKII